MSLDVQENRAARKWTKKELIIRCLWTLAHPLYRFSPRHLWSWRNFLLRLFGAKIGRGVHIHPSARIFIPWKFSVGDYSAISFNVLIYNLGEINLGENVTISHGVQLCGGTHDYTDGALPLIKSTINIKANSWICTEAFVGPGVSVGEGTVLAARGVTVKTLEAWSVYGGNPAKFIKKRVINA